MVKTGRPGAIKLTGVDYEVELTLEEAFAGASKTITIEALARCEGCNGHGSRGESRAARCGTCGFYLPLAGPMRGMFGVCGNLYAPDDGILLSGDTLFAGELVGPGTFSTLMSMVELPRS